MALAGEGMRVPLTIVCSHRRGTWVLQGVVGLKKKGIVERPGEENHAGPSEDFQNVERHTALGG